MKIIQHMSFLLLFVFIFMTGVNCNNRPKRKTKKTTNPSETSSLVLAQVDGQTITLADLEREIAEKNPIARQSYRTLEQKRGLLEKLIQREAMVIAAKRKGLEEKQSVVRAYKQILIRELVSQEFNNREVKKAIVTDEEIRKYYEQHIDRYHRPEKVRLTHIFLRAPSSQKTRRNAAKKKARRLWRDINKDLYNVNLFRQVAREHSDDGQTKAFAGRVNFKTHEELVRSYGKRFADAAFALDKAKPLSSIVEDNHGFYIIRFSSRQKALKLSFEQVKEQIRSSLFARRRQQTFERFMEKIKQDCDVKIYSDRLSKAKSSDKVARQ